MTNFKIIIIEALWKKEWLEFLIEMHTPSCSSRLYNNYMTCANLIQVAYFSPQIFSCWFLQQLALWWWIRQTAHIFLAWWETRFSCLIKKFTTKILLHENNWRKRKTRRRKKNPGHIVNFKFFRKFVTMQSCMIHYLLFSHIFLKFHNVRKSKSFHSKNNEDKWKKERVLSDAWCITNCRLRFHAEHT